MPARTSDQSLVDAATDAIRDRIIDLSLPPSTAINTKDLALQLKLSRTPVREALNRLASEGLIRIEANHGVFVHPLDVDEINQLMEANRVAERLSGFYCNFNDPGLVADVVEMQARSRRDAFTTPACGMSASARASRARRTTTTSSISIAACSTTRGGSPT